MILNFSRLDDSDPSRTEDLATGSFQPVLITDSETHIAELSSGLIIGSCYLGQKDRQIASHDGAHRDYKWAPEVNVGYQYHPCVLPMRGFQATRNEADGSQLPYLFSPLSKSVVSVAGVAKYDAADSSAKTLLVWALHVSPPSILEPFFDSFPAILDRSSVALWLNAGLISDHFPTHLIPLLHSVDLKSWSAIPLKRA